jgi:hypothetical protein
MIYHRIIPDNQFLKGLSHEMGFKTFDENLQSLTWLRDAAGFWIFRGSNDTTMQKYIYCS